MKNRWIAVGVLALGVVSSVATSRGESFSLVEGEDMAMDGGSFGDTALEDCWDDAPVCFEASRDGDVVFLDHTETWTFKSMESFLRRNPLFTIRRVSGS